MQTMVTLEYWTSTATLFFQTSWKVILHNKTYTVKTISRIATTVKQRSINTKIFQNLFGLPTGLLRRCLCVQTPTQRVFGRLGLDTIKNNRV